MKIKAVFKITTTIVVFLFVQNSFAQVTKVDTLNEVVIHSTSMVSKEVAKAFSKNFKNAVSPRWYKMDQNYLVKFITKDQKNHALYNKKGSLIYHISYLLGSFGLPKDVRGLINGKYPNCKVLTAIHIDQDNRSIWVVNLKAYDELVLARVEEEQVEEIERVKEISK
jgi:hypothetical protein